MKSSFMIIFGILMAIATVKGKSYILVILNTYFSIVMLNLKTVNCLFTTTRKDGYLRNIVLVNFFDVIELRQLCVFKNWYQWMTQFLIKYLNFMTRHVGFQQIVCPGNVSRDSVLLFVDFPNVYAAVFLDVLT